MTLEMVEMYFLDQCPALEIASLSMVTCYLILIPTEHLGMVTLFKIIIKCIILQ